MVSWGVSFEGYTHVPLKRKDSGHVVPDATVEELDERHRQSLRNQVEAGQALESLGYEFVIHSEHHSSLAGPVSPNPVLTHAAIARETESIRLLQMANILPWHEPVRLTEQLNMLDVLSDGRLEVGVGQGMSDPAGPSLGQHWSGSRSMSSEAKHRCSFEENYEILRAAWDSDFVSHRGENHSIPPAYAEHDGREHEYRYLDDAVCEHDPEAYLSVEGDTVTQNSLPILPGPEQSPHPQVWTPAGSPSSARWAAKRGVNICTHLSDIEAVQVLADEYYQTARANDWPDRRQEYDGVPFDRGWDEDRRRGIGVLVPLLHTDIVDVDTMRRWKLAYERMLANREDLAVDDEADTADVDVDGFLDSGLTPIYGDTATLIDGLNEVLRGCEFEDALFIAGVNNIGLTHDEHLAQLESIARDIRPHVGPEAR